jgi:hypothetical protein
VPGTRFRVPGNPNPGHFYPASCIPRVRVFQRQVPGTGYRIRWPAFGPRPGQRGREGRTSLAPHPSMAEGRIPRTEPGDRLSGTWDLVPGTGAGPTPRAGYRAPRTEQPPRLAWFGSAEIRSPSGRTAIILDYPRFTLLASRRGCPSPGTPFGFYFFQGLGRSGADAGGFSPDGDPVVRAEVTGAGLGSGRPGVPGGPRWDRGSW